MKPLGYRGIAKEVNSLDKMPSKKVKKWKKGERQKVLREIKKMAEYIWRY